MACIGMFVVNVGGLLGVGLATRPRALPACPKRLGIEVIVKRLAVIADHHLRPFVVPERWNDDVPSLVDPAGSLLSCAARDGTHSKYPPVLAQ